MDYTGILLSLIVWSSLFIFVFFATEGTIEEKVEKDWYYFERFFYYSGIKYIYRTFIPAQKNEKTPFGVLWIIGLYFAAFGFTTQRYESQLERVEYKYSIFIAQMAAGETFQYHKILRIFNTKIPVKPSIQSPASIFYSFCYDQYYMEFYEVYSDGAMSAADVIKSETVREWHKKLDDADFQSAQLKNVNFWNASLKRANFYKAQLEEAIFTNVNLENVNFGIASLNHASFRGTQLKGVEFKDADLQNADFREALIEQSNFNDAQFKGATFADVDFKKIIFENALLEHANFQGAKFEGVRFENTNLQKANFKNARINQTDFFFAKLNAAIFKNANCKNANFIGSQLEGATFESAQLQNAKFGRSSVKNVSFWNANLDGADFGHEFLNTSSEFILEDIYNKLLHYFFSMNVTGLEAEQLIVANSIYGIKNCPASVLNKIEEYGCTEMINKPRSEWSLDFIVHRAGVIIKIYLKKKGLYIY